MRPTFWVQQEELAQHEEEGEDRSVVVAVMPTDQPLKMHWGQNAGQQQQLGKQLEAQGEAGELLNQ